MCNIAAGRTAPVTCTGTTPGTYFDQMWFFNQNEMAASTVTNGVFDTITMDATKTSFRVDIEKGSGNFRAELVVNEETGARTYDYIYTARIASVSTSDRNFLNSLTNWKGTVIGRTKSDTFPAFGVQGLHDPLTTSVLTFTTEEGEFGGTVELRSTGNTELAPHFFDTNVSDTVLALVATQ